MLAHCPLSALDGRLADSLLTVINDSNHFSKVEAVKLDLHVADAENERFGGIRADWRGAAKERLHLFATPHLPVQEFQHVGPKHIRGLNSQRLKDRCIRGTEMADGRHSR
jgi:hypothetical protein